MKKLLILLILFGNMAFGAVDECKSDVYFANGIDTNKKAADAYIRILKKEFKSFNPALYSKVANWKVNYNHTHGIAIDLYESFLQKIYEDEPVSSLAPFIWNLDEIADYFSWSFRDCGSWLEF